MWVHKTGDDHLFTYGKKTNIVGQELGRKQMSLDEAGINGMLNHLEAAFYYTEAQHQLQQSSYSAAAAAAVAYGHHGQLGNVAKSLGKLPQGKGMR
jgi:hypothetical protein